jgi:hypothetical protein
MDTDFEALYMKEWIKRVNLEMQVAFLKGYCQMSDEDFVGYTKKYLMQVPA